VSTSSVIVTGAAFGIGRATVEGRIVDYKVLADRLLILQQIGALAR
jgi:hypothetical protein